MKTILFSTLILMGTSFSFAEEKSKEQIIEVKATESGFEPSSIDVTSESPVILKVTRTTDQTCATELQIKKMKIDQKLPLNKTVTVNLGKLKKGDTTFACSMNMMKGVLHVK